MTVELNSVHVTDIMNRESNDFTLTKRIKIDDSIYEIEIVDLDGHLFKGKVRQVDKLRWVIEGDTLFERIF